MGSRNKQQIIDSGKQLLGAILAKEEDAHPLCRQIWALVEELQQLERCDFVTACAHFSLGRKCSTRYVVKLAEQGKFPTYRAFVESYEAEKRKQKREQQKVKVEANQAPKADKQPVKGTQPPRKPTPHMEHVKESDYEALQKKVYARETELAKLRLLVKDLHAEIDRKDALIAEQREQMGLLQTSLHRAAERFAKLRAAFSIN